MISNVEFMCSTLHRNIILNKNVKRNFDGDDLRNYNCLKLQASIENSELGIGYVPRDQQIRFDFRIDFANNSTISNVDFDFGRLIASFNAELDFYEALEKVEIFNGHQINKNDFKELFPNAKFISMHLVYDDGPHYFIYDLGDGVKRKMYLFYYLGLGLLRTLYREYLKTHKNDDELELDRTIVNFNNLETDFVSEISDDTLKECLLSISDKKRFDYHNISMDIKNKDDRLKLAKYLWDSKRSGINGREFPSLNVKKYYIDKFLYIEPYYELTGRPVENCGEFSFRSNVNIRTVEIEKIENTVSSETLEFLKNAREIDHIDDEKVYYVDKNGNHRTIKVLKVGRNTPDFVLLPRSLMR